MTFFPLHYDLLWVLAEWVVRIGALAVVPLRRSPAAAAGWLLLIFFIPVVGLPLYLLIGRPRFSPERERRWKQLHPFFADLRERMVKAHPARPGDVADFAQRLGRMPCVDGNSIELIDDYDAMIDRLVADIEGAEQTVELLVYIFADDDIGKRITAEMMAAMARGVRCRVMLDQMGSRPWLPGSVKMLRDAGVEVREALPVRLWRRRADMRNHRKLFVIDGKIGYAGSQNLVAKNFRPGVTNRELVARVTGPVVASMAAIVAADWLLEEPGDPKPAPVAIPKAAGDLPLQLLPSGADYPLEGFETLLVWQIHRAQRRVVIVTPYFIPDEDVSGAMRSAAVRGVEVDLVVSAVVDQRIVHLAQCSYFDGLLAAGVRIHRYKNFLLHAKNATFDDGLGIVGSSNVDVRSFQLNEEASLLLFDPAVIEQLQEIQQGYMAGSERLELEQWRTRPRSQRLQENLARIMSPLF